ncbi:phosphoglycerate dehydrogenase [Lutispora saccharofermentans]|uniref:Phosphoglycerate dehydrogenase n=1 Tax=Lutispora saccharofermentans TaxID=3024236 RepID=A0ABT1NAL8_9FIRM|nr:phosphoglycerate dehydrogenase [Lutispora saccharofermentans]MCQ1528277.1 phosphoglycerate dehydrogenase [Lutispora saccharofermentans]
MKVLFTYNYGEEKMKAIAELGYEVIYADEKEIVYRDEISDIDALVCYNPFDKLDISDLKQLKWIQLSSIGIDQLPKHKAIEKRIIVTNNKSGYSIPIGEWIVLKTLELLKNSSSFYSKQSEKKWKIDPTVLELYNKTVCFVGTGSIAGEAAKRLRGFEVKIIGINTSGKKTGNFDICYPIKELEYALSQADIVVLSVPYTKETHHLIDEKSIGFIKKGACLINIARGSIIKEPVLIEALEKGEIRGAALDVFEEEPLPEDSPLWNMNNVIITPHNSWVSEMRSERRYNIIYENMKRFISGERLMNIVDIEKGY